MKKCVSCGEEIHPKRLEILPNTTQCVKCSTTGKKAGVTVTLGEGDHTYNETVILEPEEFEKYQEIEYQLRGPRKDDIPHPDEEIEEEDEDDELEGIEEINLNLEDLEE
jgi:hypothetical protein